MIGTETKLWRHILNGVSDPTLIELDRIESPITPGASDVTYVCPNGSGWIELKTAKWPKAARPLRLNHEFSFEQAQWLLRHHKPSIHLRSWLLVGFAGKSSWEKFLLLDAYGALVLIDGRPSREMTFILKNSGAFMYDSIDIVLTRIRS